MCQGAPEGRRSLGAPPATSRPGRLQHVWREKASAPRTPHAHPGRRQRPRGGAADSEASPAAAARGPVSRKRAGLVRPPLLPRCRFSVVSLLFGSVRSGRSIAPARGVMLFLWVAQGWVWGHGHGPCTGLTGWPFGGRTGAQWGQQLELWWLVGAHSPLFRSPSGPLRASTLLLSLCET